MIPLILSAINSASPVVFGKNHPESEQTGSDRDAKLQSSKLRRAASEFESILISTFWKSMLESFSSDEDSADPGGATFKDMGIQAMSQAIGKAGGLGLGTLIIKHLEQGKGFQTHSSGR